MTLQNALLLLQCSAIVLQSIAGPFVRHCPPTHQAITSCALHTVAAVVSLMISVGWEVLLVFHSPSPAEEATAEIAEHLHLKGEAYNTEGTRYLQLQHAHLSGRQSTSANT